MELNQYWIAYYVDEPDELYFECYAEDEGHAIEQLMDYESSAYIITVGEYA